MSIRDCIKKISKTLPWYVQDFCVYTLKFGRFPNIKNPKTFNEKVLYRKNFKMNVPLFIELADKYRVRRYIEENIGRQYLIPLLFVTEDPEELKNSIGQRTVSLLNPTMAPGCIKLFILRFLQPN